MTVIGEDTFIRSATAGSWGTATDGQVWSKNDNVTANILSTNGQFGRIQASTPFGSNIMLLGTRQITNVEITMKFQFTTSGSLIDDDMGAVLKFKDLNNWFKVEYKQDISVNAIRIRRRLSGTTTQIGSVTIPALHSGGAGSSQLAWMKTAINGTRITAKVWPDGTIEPSFWQISLNDASHAGLAQYGIQCGPSGGTSNILSFQYFRAVDNPIEELQKKQETITVSTFPNVTVFSYTATVTHKSIETITVGTTIPPAVSTTATEKPRLFEQVIVNHVAVPDPNRLLMLKDLEAQYKRLWMSLPNKLKFVAVVYYQDAAKGGLITGELDVVLKGESVNQFHALKSINDVSLFILENQ